MCGCHGVVRIIDTGEREVAKDAALVNRTAPRVVARGDAVLAIDIKRMGGA
ncbi:MAG TPA: hypothetical protein VF866_08055 [Xanthobacteraceae bacterium]